MELLGKRTFDKYDLKAADLVRDALGKFAVDHEIGSVVELERVDTKRSGYKTRDRKQMIKISVSGWFIYDQTQIRYSTEVFGPAGSTELWLDSIIWFKFCGREGHIFPLAGVPGNRGIGRWDKHPIAFQYEHDDSARFTEVIASLQTSTN